MKDGITQTQLAEKLGTTAAYVNSMIKKPEGCLMSIFWTQKVKLFYAALLANNSH